MLGFSVYLSHDLTADDYNYLIAMRNAGFNTVFTSLLDHDNGEVERLNELGKWCKNLDLKVIADISKESLKFLEIQQLTLMKGLVCLTLLKFLSLSPLC